MKRLASCLLFLMMLSLAACGESKDDFGVKYGGIGDTMSTEWFDFVVEDAYSCGRYHSYAPSAGDKLVIVTMSLKNNCGQPVDMWGEDFVILWGGDDGAAGVDIPLPAGLSDDQFPDEYVLDASASRTGVMVFEVPREFRDFGVRFMEIFDDGGEGNTFFVDFTAEDR